MSRVSVSWVPIFFYDSSGRKPSKSISTVSAFIPERRRRVLRQEYYHRRVLVLLLRQRNKVAVFGLEAWLCRLHPMKKHVFPHPLGTYVYSIHGPDGDAVNTWCTQGKDGERWPLLKGELLCWLKLWYKKCESGEHLPSSRQMRLRIQQLFFYGTRCSRI